MAYLDQPAWYEKWGKRSLIFVASIFIVAVFFSLYPKALNSLFALVRHYDSYLRIWHFHLTDNLQNKISFFAPTFILFLAVMPVCSAWLNTSHNGQLQIVCILGTITMAFVGFSIEKFEIENPFNGRQLIYFSPIFGPAVILPIYFLCRKVVGLFFDLDSSRRRDVEVYRDRRARRSAPYPIHHPYPPPQREHPELAQARAFLDNIISDPLLGLTVDPEIVVTILIENQDFGFYEKAYRWAEIPMLSGNEKALLISIANKMQAYLKKHPEWFFDKSPVGDW